MHWIAESAIHMDIVERAAVDPQHPGPSNAARTWQFKEDRQVAQYLLDDITTHFLKMFIILIKLN